MRAMTKSELAEAAGVPYKVFQRWLQDPYMQKQLAPLNLKKQQHILPPNAVKIIIDHYAIEID